jgi:hypothetical protein
VVPGFRSSVEKSLNEIGIRPRFVSLPSQAKENNIDIKSARRLDWSSILVIFGYCILLLFNLKSFNNDADGYKNYISNCIRGLQAKFRWDPSNRLEIPFDVTKAYAISTMLGSNDLCATVKKFRIDNSDHQDSQVGIVCKYLSVILS